MANALVIIFSIIAVIGLIMFIAGIILAETKYSGLSNPWQVQVLVWGGLIIFGISVIIVAIGAAMAKKKKEKEKMKKMQREGKVVVVEEGCRDAACSEYRIKEKKKTSVYE